MIPKCFNSRQKAKFGESSPLTHLAPVTFLSVIRNHRVPQVTLGNVIEVHETFMPGGTTAFCLLGMKPVRDTCNMSWYSLRQKNRSRTVHRSRNNADLRRWRVSNSELLLLMRCCYYKAFEGGNRCRYRKVG